MIVFIDDSGDPGFAIKKGATPNFVIACIIFDDELVAEETALAIKKYRRKLNFPDETEFKFAKSRDQVRKGFLKTISKFDFKIRAIVVDKQLIKSKELQRSKDSFYNYFIKQVLFHNRGTLSNAKIRLDGHGNKLFKKNLTSYLRKELNSNKKKIMKDVKLVDSKTNVLIQMADMVAGSIRRAHCATKNSDKSYQKIIKNKIEDSWEFK